MQPVADRIGWSRLRCQQAERCPEDGGKNQERQPQMGSEPVLADARIIHQPALHHVPPNCSLQRPEQEDPEQAQGQPGPNLTAESEVEQRQEEHQAHRSPQQAVKVFPPEDSLESVQRHPEVHLLVLGGLLVLYVPTFYDLASTLWQRDDLAHGPIILAVIVWLIWDKREVLLNLPTRTAPVVGLPLLGFGLLLYIVGRSQEIILFEVGALAPILERHGRAVDIIRARATVAADIWPV